MVSGIRFIACSGERLRARGAASPGALVFSTAVECHLVTWPSNCSVRAVTDWAARRSTAANPTGRARSRCRCVSGMPGQVSIERRLNRSNCGVGALNQCSAGGHCGVELTIRAKALRRNFPDLKTVAHLLHQKIPGTDWWRRGLIFDPTAHNVGDLLNEIVKFVQQGRVVSG